MAGTIYTVKPKAGHTHTHTVIFLHGRDSDCNEFASELFESEASESECGPNGGRTLPDIFPSIKWVFPGAPTIKSQRFDTDMSQWFDMCMARIISVVAAEENILPKNKIFLAGISQGFATAIATYLANEHNEHGEFAGLIGLCSWLPITQNTQNTTLSHKTPIFLGHSKDDDVVPIKNGRGLRDSLIGRGLQVHWKEYEDVGHWINEPEGVDDMVAFMKQRMGYQTQTTRRELLNTCSNRGSALEEVQSLQCD
ncbi:Uu.00g107180.m01.CDS01 [Anthostomella pinea]|uniref:Uu.00g107180.m01.CDS01 n=1 Tax=Anthostomella pinea TaxID=933095 RepID=A0AAI8VEZ3_9PEZI|nr:Uu.00g107180.m01.CDS01 [Anthostomella pinea]